MCLGKRADPVCVSVCYAYPLRLYYRVYTQISNILATRLLSSVFDLIWVSSRSNYLFEQPFVQPVLVRLCLYSVSKCKCFAYHHRVELMLSVRFVWIAMVTFDHNKNNLLCALVIRCARASRHGFPRIGFVIGATSSHTKTLLCVERKVRRRQRTFSSTGSPTYRVRYAVTLCVAAYCQHS